jgi:hypothetical protein
LDNELLVTRRYFYPPAGDFRRLFQSSEKEINVSLIPQWAWRPKADDWNWSRSLFVVYRGNQYQFRSYITDSVQCIAFQAAEVLNTTIWTNYRLADVFRLFGNNAAHKIASNLFRISPHKSTEWILNYARNHELLYELINDELEATYFVDNTWNSRYWSQDVHKEIVVYYYNHFQELSEFFRSGIFVSTCELCQKDYTTNFDNKAYRHLCEDKLCQKEYGLASALAGEILPEKRAKLEADLWEVRRKKESRDLKVARKKLKEMRVFLNQGVCR